MVNTVTANDRSQGTPLAAALLLAIVAVYLWPFVAVGWIPHDEGTLGQAADRVLRGDLPHVQFEDVYSGGLSRIYAQVFRMFGVDLLHLRYVTFAVALATTLVTFLAVRRLLSPLGAASAAAVGLVWSFPNYLAPMPSWWLLLAAVIVIAALAAYDDRGRWQALAVAGIAVGGAVAIKQTGIYLAMAVVWALTFEHRPPDQTPTRRRLLHWTQWLAVGAGLAFVVAIMGREIVFSGGGVYLLVPILACAVTLIRSQYGEGVPSHDGPTIAHPLMVMLPWALLPIVWLLWPYVFSGELARFFHGVLVEPTLRLVLAVRVMPPAPMLLSSALVLVWLLVDVPRSPGATRALGAAAWMLAFVLPIAARESAGVYQVLWQGTRAVGALLPTVLCMQLWGTRLQDAATRRPVFLSAAVLAWMSLNQFPFASPEYFCFTAPLVVISGVTLGRVMGHASVHRLGSLGLLLGLFAVLCLNPDHEVSLGRAYQPPPPVAPLNLPRAHLVVDAGVAREYQDTVAAILEHRGSGTLVAAPDAPELYFLTGVVNDSGRFFDFFEPAPGSDNIIDVGLERWLKGSVIAINHAPGFSPPLPAATVAALVTEFPEGRRFGRYEVRWR